MNIIFRICGIFCIAANIQISLQAGEENANPDVNCLLFGNVGCHSTCALIGKLFVKGGEGTCNESYSCDCKFYLPNSIEDIWFTRFNSNKQTALLLHQLKKYQKNSPYKTALDVVKDPLLSNNKTKNLLTELLPRSKLTNSLNPSHEQLIYTYVDDIDNFNQTDSTKLSAFVNTELSTLPEKLTDEIARNYYKERLNEFVNQVNDEVTISYVTKQLKMISGSPFVTEMLKKLEEKQKLLSAEDDEEEEESRKEYEEEDESPKKLTDAIASFVTNEFINHADKKSPKINGKKFAKSNSSKPGTRLLGQGKFINPTANQRSSLWKPSVKPISHYADGKGGVTLEWEGSNSFIKYTEDMYGTVTVNWQSDNVTITLKNTYKGDANQTWKFGDVEINLHNDYMGSMDHKWNFGKRQYIYSRSYVGDISAGWTGIKDFDALSKYKNYITSWCAQNTDLFPNRCVLFTY